MARVGEVTGPLKVLLPERHLEKVRPLAGVRLTAYQGLSELSTLVGEADALWLDFMPPADLRQAVEAGGRLRWVSTLGAGVDRFPLELMRERGIQLTNGAGLAATPISEYVVMGMLAAAKGFPELVRAQDRREWLREPPARGELQGSRALILGYGGIGRAISERLTALGVDVTGVGRRSEVPWRDHLGEFDWVILATPLTAETRHLIGSRELAGMKAGAWLVNISRGALVDSQALIAALRASAIGGAFLDVQEQEPLAPESPLWDLPNVILTPHSSWATTRLEDRGRALFEENLGRFLGGQPLRNLVDLDAGY